MRCLLAVPSLNSDITSHFFSKATKLFPVAIRQVVTDNGKEFSVTLIKRYRKPD